MADTVIMTASELAEKYVDIRRYPDGARDIRNFLLGLAMGIELAEQKFDPTAA